MSFVLPLAFEAPTINYWALSPMIVLLVGAFVGVLIEAFVNRAGRHTAQVAVALVTIVLSFAALVFMAGCLLYTSPSPRD